MLKLLSLLYLTILGHVYEVSTSEHLSSNEDRLRATGQCSLAYKCPPLDTRNNPHEKYSNPNNRHGYIHCSNGIAYCKDCAPTHPGTPSLVWDDVKKRCEWTVECTATATSEWTACSKLCDGGIKQRTVTCSYLGSPISCNKCTNRSETEIEVCNSLSCPKCTRDIDIGLLLDSSTSIEEWDVVANAAAEFVEVMQKQQDVVMKFGIVIFATIPKIVKHFSDPITADEIRKLPRITGNTETGSGLIKMKQDIFNVAYGDRPSVRNVVVVFTDGQSTKQQTTLDAARTLKNANVEIYSVGVEGANVDELNQMSSSDRHVFYTNKIRDLTTALYETLKAICPGTQD